MSKYADAKRLYRYSESPQVLAKKLNYLHRFQHATGVCYFWNTETSGDPDGIKIIFEDNGKQWIKRYWFGLSMSRDADGDIDTQLNYLDGHEREPLFAAADLSNSGYASKSSSIFSRGQSDTVETVVMWIIGIVLVTLVFWFLSFIGFTGGDCIPSRINPC